MSADLSSKRAVKHAQYAIERIPSIKLKISGVISCIEKNSKKNQEYRRLQS